MKKITAEEFERCYAVASGLTVEQLRHDYKRIVVPCDCGEDGCRGWKSTTQEREDEQREFEERMKAMMKTLGAIMETLEVSK